MRIKRILGSKRDAEGSPAARSWLGNDRCGGRVVFRCSLPRAIPGAAQASHTEIASAAVPAGIVNMSQEGTAIPGAPAAQPAAPAARRTSPIYINCPGDARRRAAGSRPGGKISPEYRKQLEEALAAFAKVNTPEFRKQLDVAIRPEFKKQMETHSGNCRMRRRSWTARSSRSR